MLFNYAWHLISDLSVDLVSFHLFRSTVVPTFAPLTSFIRSVASVWFHYKCDQNNMYNLHHMQSEEHIELVSHAIGKTYRICIKYNQTSI